MNKNSNLIMPQIIIFDWDGTLADNRNAVVESMNVVLNYYKKDEWDIIKKTHRDPNKSLKENFPNLFGNNYVDAYKMYKDTYLKLYKKYLKRVDYSLEFINTINALNNKIKFAIVSNKEKSLLFLEKDALFDNIKFFKILGNGDTKENKPSPMPIFEILKNTDIEINADNVWMIGDSKTDLDCALNASCRPIIIIEGKEEKREYFSQKEMKNKDFIWCKGGFKELIQKVNNICKSC